MKFHPSPEAAGTPVVMLAGRMLWDKGVGIFVEAARRLRAAGAKARFVLVGIIDPSNPASVAREQIEKWAAEGAIEWWGERADMPEVLAAAHIVTLPSTHREGLPKVLLEATAVGRPVIAGDVPGCREIVRHGTNGLLVPPGRADCLTSALGELLASRELRDRFGRAGRGLVEKEFSQEIVVAQTLGLYNRLLGNAWP